MSRQDVNIASLREKLVAQHEALVRLQATGESAAQTVELDQSRVGRLSRMDAMQAQAMSQASNRRRQQKLRQIEAALKRIDQDDYGYCADCDEPIALKRLDYDPAATLCIGCAGKAEL